MGNRYREQDLPSWHLRQFLWPQIKHQDLGILTVAQRQQLFLAHPYAITFL
jgi:hypothetical protein